MNTERDSEVTSDRIFQLASGYAAPFVIEAALQHRIFDRLAESSKNIQELHAASGASVRGLTALVNSLVGLGLLHRAEDHRFTLTSEAATFLVSNKPGFQGGALTRFSAHIVPRWLQLSEAVATGKPMEAINQQGPGTQFFRDLVMDLFPRNYPSAQALARTLLASGAIGGNDTALDVAAGSGVWGIAVAQVSDGVRVVANDWTDVLPITRKAVDALGLSGRFTFLEGDVVGAAFGSGYAVAILGHILHSEGERRSRLLIGKVFEALRPGGTIAVAEYLVDDDRTGPLRGLFFAVNMLISTEEGDAYSFEEIAAWLLEAGFEDVKLASVPGPSQVILAIKPR